MNIHGFVYANGQKRSSVRKEGQSMERKKTRQEQFREAAHGKVDRRIARTRHLLQQAFVETVQEKGFTATSIQDITARANVRRSTFYAHFADKYALLESMTREHFRDLLASTLAPVPQWERAAMQLLIRTVLKYFKSLHHHCYPSDLTEPLLERVIQEELAAFLRTWLQQERGRETHWRVSLETFAQVASWAIFGAAVQWSQETATAVSSEQMADDVLLIIMEGMERLVPDALPE